MDLNNYIFIFIFSLSLILFSYNLTKFLYYLKIGKREDRYDRPLMRLKRVLSIAFGQKKLLREPISGWMHFFIFWGFLILLSAIFESIAEGFHSQFSLSIIGELYKILIFGQDLVALLVLFSVSYAIIRRAVIKPKRLEGHSSTEAYIILFMIMFIMLSMFFQNSIKIILHPDDTVRFRFVSFLLTSLFEGLKDLNLYYYIFWWMHIGLVLVFLNLLPFSKHFHILTSIPNVYFAKLTSHGKLKNLDLNDITLVKYGVGDIEDFTWKQLFDGYVCTECGRCTAACPANITGKMLSPRKIIVDIRRRLIEKAPLLLSRNKQGIDDNPIFKNQLVGDYISDNELWACTTCMACVQECPVMIEHVDHIVDMRRFLVLNESRFPRELQVAFNNLERNYSPWAFSFETRTEWCKDLDVPVFSEVNNAEVLFWVGCAGAFDDRAKKVSRAMVKIFKAANVEFAILGVEEKCTGDFARRSGNEFLAQMLINENINTLNKYKFKKIVTTCPHCFNTLKNEYPDFGGNYEVVHHSVFINDLIEHGRIKLKNNFDLKTVYHDSCYLGRYNGIYDQPRKILNILMRSELKEMKRSRDKGFCCGAGGARMFLEETEGKRINYERTDEALTLDINLISTACPFCLTMLTDGVKNYETSKEIEVKDIAELVAESI